MSESVQSVAASIEEMSASLNEVSNSCQKESQSTAKASNQTKTTQEMMEKLVNSAREISSFVDVINKIAAQTNLLALNATIEAARAGASGKGFAVVATEVKELARQTAIATSEIGKQIKEMQGNTDNAVGAMNVISNIIEEVNMTSQTIATAIEEQNATLCEIAKSTSSASYSATEIAKNVDESAKGLGEIALNISEVKKAAADTAINVNQVKNSASQLSKLAKDLLEITIQFKVE
jgi:methyl-accepting chemotaxis protein